MKAQQGAPAAGNSASQASNARWITTKLHDGQQSSSVVVGYRTTHSRCISSSLKFFSATATAALSLFIASAIAIIPLFSFRSAFSQVSPTPISLPSPVSCISVSPSCIAGFTFWEFQGFCNWVPPWVARAQFPVHHLQALLSTPYRIAITFWSELGVFCDCLFSIL